MFWHILFLVPKNLLSRLTGILVGLRFPKPFGPILVQKFAKRYQIRLDEAELPIDHYPTIQALFTRKLKPGLRPIQSASVVHPADSRLTVHQTVRSGSLLQAKGSYYRLNEFLGQDLQSEFEGGQQVTYYLCPTDYHRVHSPVDGRIVGFHYIPGELWPVNDWSVGAIRQLFSRNERVVIWIETALGKVAVVMVGATNVGQMSLSFFPDFRSNSGRGEPLKVSLEPAQVVRRGDELGIFHMGSTVIVIYPKTFLLQSQASLPRVVKLGEALS